MVKDGQIFGFYPKGKIGGWDSGFTWYSDLPRPYLEATMEYDVYFMPGFDWTKGGKLPGMCGYGACREGKGSVSGVGCSAHADAGAAQTAPLAAPR